MSTRHPILLLHGFTSHISCIEPPARALEDRGFTVKTPILRGHGGHWRDLVGVTYRDWYADGESALIELFNEKKVPVMVGGFSMGGLVALELAMNHPEKITGLCLAAPALRFVDPLAPLARYLAKVIPVWPGPKSFNDKHLNKTRNKNYRFFPLGSFVSLYEYSLHIRGNLFKVVTPFLCIHSFQDRVISVESVREIVRESCSTQKDIVYLNKSGHELFLDSESERATTIMVNYFQELEATCS
ncbi:alpha/beta fold hydrolase [Myxococcota bacterium]|nr:alpha/beta fold hydrolase [Myxococcota bacterium]MBU1536473.1 alpha/beta fold hydrolase [Myxococcota bacterium]